jgi:hypothetical protein
MHLYPVSISVYVYTVHSDWSPLLLLNMVRHTYMYCRVQRFRLFFDKMEPPRPKIGVL